MRKISAIVVHCSDTPAEMNIGADEIRKWHVEENGWSDIGYHWIIRRDGQIEYGRPEHIPGAHVKGHNEESIGVCLIGGMPEANYTRQQWRSLEALVGALNGRYPEAAIKGHRDYNNMKACPGFDAAAWWGEGPYLYRYG